jgi:hypothetical protein
MAGGCLAIASLMQYRYVEQNGAASPPGGTADMLKVYGFKPIGIYRPAWRL